MNRTITDERPHFRPPKRALNPYRILLLVVLIMAGIWVLLRIENGSVKPFLLATPTPTRTANSLIEEGEAKFNSGDLEGAITAYQEATNFDPNNARLLSELARIQAYSSSLLSTDAARFQRLKEAVDSANQAAEINPDETNVQAIRAFVLDWYAASTLITPQERQTALNDAESSAVRALQLDAENEQALAFFAEILVDQQKWTQAEETIQKAVEINPNSMDVQRVYGYVLESIGDYRLAIEKYQEAARINPNLTFLYIFIGRNFLSLEVHNRALEMFEKAVQINEQLGVEDPIPYIEIAKTYVRDGEFFIAALNAEKAITLDPTNPNTYGQLGTIYTKARNYEGARPAFRCAVLGCTAEENQVAQEITGQGVAVQGLPLTSGTVAFYYAQYGSVLAALSRPNQNFCPEAMSVLGQVRDKYPDDPIFKSIIEENVAICQLVDQEINPTAISTSTGTPSP